ncbi:hypothetical protein DTO013E5_548 [Penicillium roqueforti]|nr:uncharacterized protein LCP9604111_591 [Penicillium roqueforti]KAF9253065.1 hypothetical protein LCP9604111_591 [Penicillium roqueforti]KAI1838580.1 hypothetical protein CBS147337_305 [Penicillium roqueforti]KAI2680513.1 hypothetical protein CBS147355_3493 [Penicillium roqueforti]KAI2691098.1 hypothetical protein LCP963914a_1299 [Penicillium roqueforti]KAI2706926.1 hypothetical protein CBS147372_837 [Penicillium roqueforti]
MSSKSSSTATMVSEMSDEDERPSEAFESENLSYRNYYPSEHDQTFNTIQEYASSVINFCASSSRPMDLTFTSRVAKHLQRNSDLFVMIEYYDECDPLGTLFLESSHRDMAHHRCAKLGIGMLKEFQHYEIEAIQWALNWAFNRAGLHRVEMNIPSWNMRLGKVCDEVGFQIEGKRRECFFKDGEWHDEVNMSMLKKDWVQLRA